MKQLYETQVAPALASELQISNKHQVPKITKVVLNVGINAKRGDSNDVEAAEKTLMAITGQKPVRNKARTSISNFKIRENMVVGVSVTLRGQRMYDFLDKLVNVSLPRVRDFRGLSPKNVDRQGNCTIGFKEVVMFPEVSLETLERPHGLEICITTTADTNANGLALLTKLGFPFQLKTGK